MDAPSSVKGQDVGLAVQVYRQQAKMSQIELGQTSGVDDKTISGWKKADHRIPEQRFLAPVAAALGITVSHIMRLAFHIREARLTKPHRVASRHESARTSHPAHVAEEDPLRYAS